MPAYLTARYAGKMGRFTSLVHTRRIVQYEKIIATSS
jgi:hypothetical protein